jgi:cell pole-organizing protein PopZ
MVRPQPQPQPVAIPQPLPAAPVPQAESRDDETARDRYHAANPYRFRYSLEGSQTYMALRNRLSSLSSRTRADTGRSMASLLGGDARREEARSRGHYPQQQAWQPEEQALELRSSLPPEEAHVGEYAASELVSGSVSYSPDYHEWSLEQSLDGYGMQPAPVALPGMQPAPVALPGTQPAYAEHAGEADYVQAADAYAAPAETSEHQLEEYEAEAAPEHEPETAEGGHIQLEAMIRGIIEPELANWFDEHLPDHVARAMPDEEAFIAMIRPLIEDWLADNLAPIVEQAVKDEIARITGLKR